MHDVLPTKNKHRSEYRTSAEAAVFDTFVRGVPMSNEAFDPVRRLKTLRTQKVLETTAADAPTVLHVSMYCYKSFPVRIFHVLSLKDGINSHAVFFKNNFTNLYDIKYF